MLSPSGITSKLKKDTPEYGDRFMKSFRDRKEAKFPLTFSPLLHPTNFSSLSMFISCVFQRSYAIEGWGLKGKTLQQILSRSRMHSAKYIVGSTQILLSFPYYFSESHVLTMLKFNLVWFSFFPLSWYPHLTVLCVNDHKFAQRALGNV